MPQATNHPPYLADFSPAVPTVTVRVRRTDRRPCDSSLALALTVLDPDADAIAIRWFLDATEPSFRSYTAQQDSGKQKSPATKSLRLSEPPSMIDNLLRPGLLKDNLGNDLPVHRVDVVAVDGDFANDGIETLPREQDGLRVPVYMVRYSWLVLGETVDSCPGDLP